MLGIFVLLNPLARRFNLKSHTIGFRQQTQKLELPSILIMVTNITPRKKDTDKMD